MSTIFDIRNIRLPRLSRTTVIVGSLVVVVALVVGYVGYRLYEKLTNNTVVAYFPAANALYKGDKVQIMGLRVGSIDGIEPAGDKMKVTFHYENRYKVPANASAVILNPTLVASRAIQLEPPYKGGPTLSDNAVIPEERTQVPVEWDELRNSITNIISKLGPTKEQPTGPFGEVISSFADGLAGKSKQINTALNSLSSALTALNEGRGDFFAVVRSLALFVNALHQDDAQFVALNENLADVTGRLASSDGDFSNALQQFDSLLTTVRPWLALKRKTSRCSKMASPRTFQYSTKSRRCRSPLFWTLTPASARARICRSSSLPPGAVPMPSCDRLTLSRCTASVRLSVRLCRSPLI